MGICNRLEYERPSADVIDVRMEFPVLSGSNLEDPSDGGEWDWN